MKNKQIKSKRSQHMIQSTCFTSILINQQVRSSACHTVSFAFTISASCRGDQSNALGTGANPFTEQIICFKIRFPEPCDWREEICCVEDLDEIYQCEIANPWNKILSPEFKAWNMSAHSSKWNAYKDGALHQQRITARLFVLIIWTCIGPRMMYRKSIHLDWIRLSHSE